MIRHFVPEYADLSKEPDWHKVYAFVSLCGKAHDPKSFAAAVITHATDLIRFDNAIVYFLDGNAKIIDQHLENLAEEFSRIYKTSFANMTNNAYNINQDIRENPNKLYLNIMDWSEEPPGDFRASIIDSRGLKYTLALLFYDLYGRYRTILCLDKTTPGFFEEKELINLQYAYPLLIDLHKNFFYDINEFSDKTNILNAQRFKLTKRETEIARMLCQGVSPANISKSLYISSATTYKHIANIYEKLNVKSQRELLALMLNQ